MAMTLESPFMVCLFGDDNSVLGSQQAHFSGPGLQENLDGSLRTGNWNWELALRDCTRRKESGAGSRSSGRSGIGRFGRRRSSMAVRWRGGWRGGRGGLGELGLTHAL